MAQNKRYKIGDKEYFVQVLNVNQQVEVVKILRRCGVLEVGLDVNRVTEAIAEHEELHHFLATILIPVNGKFEKDKLQERMKEVGELSGDDEPEVIQDFFDKNGNWLKKLDDIFEKQFPKKKTANPKEPDPQETVTKNS